jgi:NAD-dependent deacetylase
MDSLPLGGDAHLLILTGAGISAESGIPTFRGLGSEPFATISEAERERLVTPTGMLEEPEKFWRYYAARREGLRKAHPNAAHRALAALEPTLGDRMLVATQNVDGLHLRAGSQRLIELHGNLRRSRCMRCDRPPFSDETSPAAPPRCERCADQPGWGGRPALLRPDIVLFEEHLDPQHLAAVSAFIRKGKTGRLLFLAVGTSGTVFPASALVHEVARHGGESWLLNAEPAENGDAFDHVVLGAAAATLPKLLGQAGGRLT